MSFRFWIVGLALFFTLTGCSQQVSPPATVPVSGSVLLHGKPAPGIRVTLHPRFKMGRIQWGVVGETGPTGEFTLGTGGIGNGAPPGNYVATFTKPRADSDLEHNGLDIEVDDFEGKFSDPEESMWAVSIKQGENRLEPFELD